MDFGKRLKRIREEKNWTQTELSKRIKISQPTIHDYERGVSMPRPDTLVNISKTFNVTTDYLLGVVDEPTKEDKTMSKEEKLDRMAQSNSIFDPKKIEMVKNLSDEEAEYLLNRLKEHLKRKGKSIPW